MTVLRPLLLLALPLMMGACRTTRMPSSDREMARLTSIQQFEGLYQNRSATDGRALSDIVFPGINTKREITTIRVTQIGPDQLKVEGLNGSDVLREKVFVKGKDFQASGSTVPTGLKSSAHAVEPNPDAWFAPPIYGAGASVRSGSLYLNKRGDVVYHESTTGAALVFYVVPVPGSIQNYSLFKRL